MKNDIEKCLKIAACICGRDGVISEAEECIMFQLASNKCPSLKSEDFEKVLDEYFDSDNQIEDYLEQVVDVELRKFALMLSEKSASADGLDIRENIALSKAYALWGLKPHE